MYTKYTTYEWQVFPLYSIALKINKKKTLFDRTLFPLILDHSEASNTTQNKLKPFTTVQKGTYGRRRLKQ